VGKRRDKDQVRFRGRFERTLDHKGRLAIPARFRHILESQSDGAVVLTRGHDQSLELFPLTSWEEFEVRELLSLPYSKIQARRYRRHYTFQIKEDRLDHQGRVLIPDFLLSYAGIKKEVIIVGEIDKITIWSPEEYQKFQDSILEHFPLDSEEIESIRRRDESKR